MLKRKNKPVHQAPEAEQVAAVTTTDDSKRKSVSKRSYLDENGETKDVKIETAKGARYTLLDPNGNQDIDYVYGTNPDFDRMCAMFGFHTKVGNVANTVLNDKDEPGTPADAAAKIKEWMADAQSADDPTWAERTGGVGGARVDRDALAGSIVAVLLATVDEKTGKPLLDPANESAQYAKVRQRLEDEPAYLRGARSNPDVAREYATRTGKAQKTVADLL
jgi:hypothetical protein